MLDINEIRKLTVEERISLVKSIWDSIAEDTDPVGIKIPETEKAEILARIQSFEASSKKTYSWDEVVSYALEP